MDDPNAFIWWLPDHLGRLFWLPLVGYGGFGMFYLYKLAAPATRQGRVIRLFLALAFLSMIFSPLLTGLGPWAMHFLAIGAMLMVYQTYFDCLSKGKIIKPTSETAIERMADRIHEPRRAA